MPRHLQRSAPDRRIASGIVGESWIRRRLKEGRNIYRDLIAFADRIGAPVALDATNELLHQLRRHAPSTLQKLAGAYQAGTIVPVYVAAHHTHPALLESDEFIDELRLNREAIHGLLGAPEPMLAGLFFTECSIDTRHVSALEHAGYRYTFAPKLADRYPITVDGEADLQFAPFRIGAELVALPRHFAVSQEIWRPLTLRFPERVKYQGFLVGQTPVFADEYRSGIPHPPEPDEEKGIELYADTLRRALAEAPDGGLIVYLQDLELMDFGEAALTLLGAAWQRVEHEEIARVEVTTPEEFLRHYPGSASDLVRVHFRRASWAPELRPALRSDGHYPPRGAGPFRSFDADREIFFHEPFIFWEPGRFPTETFGWLIDAFGVHRIPHLPAATLFDEEYRIERFPPSARLPLLFRLMRRACNWGWYPEEGMTKRAFLDGYLIAEALRLELGLGRLLPTPRVRLPDWAFEGLRRLPEILIDPRIDAVTFALERWRDERGGDPRPAQLELEEARACRRSAPIEIGRALAAYQMIMTSTPRDHTPWRQLCSALRDYCGALFLTFDHIQRAWGKADPEFLITPMYRYVYDLFPPRGPQILAEIYGHVAEVPPPELQPNH